MALYSTLSEKGIFDAGEARATAGGTKGTTGNIFCYFYDDGIGANFY
ncbi:hypothetical protein ACTAZI_04445 [Legionella bozemanae]